MDLSLGQVIVWGITGMLAGFLATRLFGKKGFGFLANLVIGLLGALVGGALFALLNIDINIQGVDPLTFRVADLITAFVGALILLVIIGYLQRRR